MRSARFAVQHGSDITPVAMMRIAQPPVGRALKRPERQADFFERPGRLKSSPRRGRNLLRGGGDGTILAAPWLIAFSP